MASAGSCTSSGLTQRSSEMEKLASTWVLMFKGYLCLKCPSSQEVLAVVVIGTSIYVVLLIDGYLCSREYGMQMATVVHACYL